MYQKRVFLSLFALLLLSSAVNASSIGDNKYCSWCQFIVTIGESFAQKNSTETEIEHFLQFACQRLPSKYDPECTSFINQFPQIIDYIIQRESPDVACTQIGVCTQNIRKYHNSTCNICDKTVENFQEYIKERKSIHEFIFHIRQICGDFSVSDRDICYRILEIYSPQIIFRSIDGEKPDDICYHIGICN